MSKEKQKIPGDSVTPEVASSQFQANVSPEAESSEQVIVEVHPMGVSFKKSQKPREKQGVSETGGYQSPKSGQDLENGEFLESGRSKSEESKGKGILRRGAVKSKNLRQGNFESRGALKSGGIDSKNDTHLEEEISLDAEGETSEIEKNAETAEEGLNVTAQDQPQSQRLLNFGFLLGHFLRNQKERYLRRIRNGRERIREWWKESTCRRQLTREWMYYVFWLSVWFLCLIWAAMVCPNERDVPICIIFVITFCCGVTLLCKRKCLVEWMEYVSRRCDAMHNSQRLQDENEYIKRPTCFDCVSCSSEEYVKRPRGGYKHVNRRTGIDNRNTVFEEEDGLRRKSEECPQLTQNEEVSSDSPRKRRRKRRKALTHLSEAEIQEILDKWICQLFGITCSIPEGDRSPTRKNPYIKYVRHAKKKPESKSTPPAEDSFRCEHYGQGVACGCAEKASLLKPAEDDSSCECCGNVVCTCLEIVADYEPEVTSREPPPKVYYLMCEYCDHVSAISCSTCRELAPKYKSKIASPQKSPHDDVKSCELVPKCKSEVTSRESPQEVYYLMCDRCGRESVIACRCRELPPEYKSEIASPRESPHDDVKSCDSGPKYKPEVTSREPPPKVYYLMCNQCGLSVIACRSCCELPRKYRSEIASPQKSPDDDAKSCGLVPKYKPEVTSRESSPDVLYYVTCVYCRSMRFIACRTCCEKALNS